MRLGGVGTSEPFCYLPTEEVVREYPSCVPHAYKPSVRDERNQPTQGRGLRHVAPLYERRRVGCEYLTPIVHCLVHE